MVEVSGKDRGIHSSGELTEVSGNAYGVVTRYTVAARPTGTFWGGNLIFFGNQSTAVLTAIRDFTLYNSNPK